MTINNKNIQNQNENTTGNKPELINNKKFTPDISLKHEKEDLFHHSDFVDVLEYVIENSDTPDTSLNVALYGRWGVGKSTILNFLEERVNTKENLQNKYQFVNIDAWKLSPASIRQELLLELNKTFEALEPEEIEDKLWHTKEEQISSKTSFGKAVKRAWPYLVLFGAILGGGYALDQISAIDLLSTSAILSVTIPILIAMVQTLGIIAKSADRTSKRIIPRMESSQQFQKLFTDIIEKKKKPKLIIAVDNLDRCEDEVVVNILGTIKTFMSVKDCIYIISCDENAIIKHLKARGGKFYDEREAIEFLTKFFQITLHIPPQIEGDLESYADEKIKEFAADITLAPSVKDVLISGITKNPRKIRQFLYNIVVLYKLAQIKEKKGIIYDQTVTGNTPFLAKIVVLRDEWPEFYRRLELKEDLLDLMQNYLDGFTTNEEEQKLADEILKNNPGLEYFLKAMSTVKALNIQPFLRLNQEPFESAISELDSFILEVSHGDVANVISKLAKLDEDKKSNYIQSIIKQNDVYVKNHRFPFASNSMKVLLEIYDQMPDNLKTEVLSKFESYLTTKEIRGESVLRYDIDKLFPLVIKMSTHPRDILLKEYCSILMRSISTGKILNHFMNNASILSADVIESFNQNLQQLGQSRPEELEKALEILSNNEKAKHILIGWQSIDELITRFGNITTQDGKRRIELYLKIKDVATAKSKLRFVERMLADISTNKTNALSGESQLAYDYLKRLSKDDFTREASDVLYNETKNLVNQFNDENNKLRVVEILLKAFPSMSESNRNEFAQQYLAGPISSLSPNFLSQVCEFAKSDNSNILSHDVVLDNIVSKLSQGPMNENVMSFLITDTPEDKKEKIATFIINTIKSRDPARFQSVANAFGKNYSLFSDKTRDAICKECMDVGKALGWNQTVQLFDAVANSLEKCSKEIKNEFADIMLSWVKSGDQNQRQNGLTILGKSYNNLSKEKQTFVIKQLLLKLETLFSQNDGSTNQVLAFLTTNIESMKGEELDKLLDILIGQLASGSPPMQMLALNNVNKIKMRKRIDEVIRAILDLAKASSDKSVKDSCATVLKLLLKSATKDMKEEAKQLFGDSILN